MLLMLRFSHPVARRWGWGPNRAPKITTNPFIFSFMPFAEDQRVDRLIVATPFKTGSGQRPTRGHTCPHTSTHVVDAPRLTCWWRSVEPVAPEPEPLAERAAVPRCAVPRPSRPSNRGRRDGVTVSRCQTFLKKGVRGLKWHLQSTHSAFFYSVPPEIPSVLTRQLSSTLFFLSKHHAFYLNR